jgi:hypothetical protein
MDVFLVILILIILALLVFLVIPIKLHLLLCLDTGFYFTVAWHKIFKVKAELKEIDMYMSIYFLNWRIKTNRLLKKKSGLSMRKALSIDETYLKACYALNTPYQTGLMLVPMSIIGKLPSIRSFELIPDFFSSQEYIYVDGGTKLNIGKTINNILRLKEKKR